MKAKILGSGGCVSIPRPLCQCRVCTEAREKGWPYARCGCSLFMEDMNLLIDTPEDICYALNNADIRAVEGILYSHIDPDHTMGMRVIEQLRLDWLAYYEGRRSKDPLMVGALPAVMENLRKQCTGYGSMMQYYEGLNLVKAEGITSLECGRIQIKMVPANRQESVAIFVFEEGERKLVYAPCDVKPFPENSIFQNTDCLIIGNTVVGEVLKDGYHLPKDSQLREEQFSIEEVLQLKEKYNIQRVIITHLEEDWGKSYDDYLDIQKQYSGIEFAFDGMEIILSQDKVRKQ